MSESIHRTASSSVEALQCKYLILRRYRYVHQFCNLETSLQEQILENCFKGIQTCSNAYKQSHSGQAQGVGCSNHMIHCDPVQKWSVSHA